MHAIGVFDVRIVFGMGPNAAQKYQKNMFQIE